MQSQCASYMPEAVLHCFCSDIKVFILKLQWLQKKAKV
jgi:hypothetical protein